MDKRENKLKADLADEINELKSALFGFYDNLKYVYDEELVDYYTYQIKAFEAKYGYLLKKIKEIERKVDIS